MLYAQPVLGGLRVEAWAQAPKFRQFWVQIPALFISYVTSEKLLTFSKPPFLFCMLGVIVS